MLMVVPGELATVLHVAVEAVMFDRETLEASSAELHLWAVAVVLQHISHDLVLM